MRQRYGPEIPLQQLFDRRRPGGPHSDSRRLPASRPADRFDGVWRHRLRQVPSAGRRDGVGLFGCRQCTKSLPGAIASCVEVVARTALFSGFCYTQFTDTFQEANGLSAPTARPRSPSSGSGKRRRSRAAIYRSGCRCIALTLTKPDGRELTLYSRQPVWRDDFRAPSPFRRSRLTPIRTCAGTRCAASGSPTPPTARIARSCRRPSTIRCAGHERSGKSHRSAARHVGHGGIRKPLSVAGVGRQRCARADRADRAGPRQMRSRRLHPRPDALDSALCRSITSNCS